MKHSKFTKARLNTMIAMATGTMMFSRVAKGRIAVPDFCKMLGITQKKIQEMNHKSKQLRKDAKTKTTG